MHHLPDQLLASLVSLKMLTRLCASTTMVSTVLEILTRFSAAFMSPHSAHINAKHEFEDGKNGDTFGERVHHAVKPV